MAQKTGELTITYVKDFGKDSDLCLVAEINGTLVGAIWTRIFPELERGFGYVNDKTPELSMSVSEGHRKMGIGIKLLNDMINKLKDLQYEQVSLSVNRLNYAYKMYQEFGFEDVSSDEKSAIMVKPLIQRD
ncbi:MAG TPA: GNAT family N-acetyltransferase [Pedobacter sp.]|jgi:ribosomal protein S18 acetylase RimI-like enzyme